LIADNEPLEEDADENDVQKQQDDPVVTKAAVNSNNEDPIEFDTTRRPAKQDKSKPRSETTQEPDEKDEKIAALEEKLAQALEDNQQLDDKYRNLLGKVATIRTSLGDRLKQDAVRLFHCQKEIAFQKKNA